MDMKMVSNILEEFDGVKVVSYSSNMSMHGNLNSEITVMAYEDCENEMPPALMKIAKNVNYIAQLEPIDILGKLDVAEHSPTTMEMTFNVDRMFIFKLKEARANYVYKKLNKEVDEDIEKWLCE